MSTHIFFKDSKFSIVDSRTLGFAPSGGMSLNELLEQIHDLKWKPDIELRQERVDLETVIKRKLANILHDKSVPKMPSDEFVARVLKLK